MENINKHIVELYICDLLDSLGFNICNINGEDSEVEYVKIVEGIYDSIQEDKPEFPYQYIKGYMNKNYKYNIK